MPRLDTTAVIVLAAGEGRRMGSPKALMEFDGEAWWRRQQRALATLGVLQVWIVSPQVEAILADADDAPPLRHVGDPEAPPFDSLLIGLQALMQQEVSGVFVLPVDVPCPLRAVWQALAGPDGPTVPVQGERRGHPPFLPWAWVERRILSAGAATPQRLDEVLRGEAVEVQVLDPRVVLNLNTPDDLARYRALFDSEGG